MTVATLEPKGCPFSKGIDGLCSYHRDMFAVAMKNELIMAHIKLAAVVEGKRTRSNLQSGKLRQGGHRL